MGNDIFCFIPAKAASKRLKNKNTKKLVGKPMINYVIEAAKASKIFKDHIYVSTESENTAKIDERTTTEGPELAKVREELRKLKEKLKIAIEKEKKRKNRSWAQSDFNTKKKK